MNNSILKTVSEKFRIGLLVNPWAGIGGKFALKGSDGNEVINHISNVMNELNFSEQERANVHQYALSRVKSFLQALKPYADQLIWISCPGAMGADLFQESNLFANEFQFQIIEPDYAANWTYDLNLGLPKTSEQDTHFLARKLLEQKPDILIFAGGDGTARNIAEVAGIESQVCLGIPCGVKMHSGVFARTPEMAAELLTSFITEQQVKIEEAEVRDIDEQALRQGFINSKYFASLLVPSSSESLKSVQACKQGGLPAKISEVLAQQEIAAYVTELIQDQQEESVLIIGPGSTTQEVKRVLASDVTLLGVDVYLGSRLIQNDVSEQDILQLLHDYPEASAHIVVSIPGGQGFVFGRGNQQISSQVIKEVLRRAEIKKPNHSDLAAIEILATESKLAGFQGEGLFVDTGDRALDLRLSGSYPVIYDYQKRKLCKLHA